MYLADMLIDLYAAESTILRVEKLRSMKPESSHLYENIAKCFLSDALERINLSGKHAITGFSEGDELRMMLLGLKRFTKYEALNTTAIRREVADFVIAAGGYTL